MLKTTIAGLAAGTALATGVALTPGPAFAGDEPTACQRVWDALPAELQDDIREAVALSPRAQRRAVLDIRYDALHGDYGAQVQRWAERIRERRIAAYRSFPAELKADIRAARALPFHAQRRALAEIRAEALEGGYGEDVQRMAERRKAFYEGCDGVAASLAGSTGDPLAG